MAEERASRSRPGWARASTVHEGRIPMEKTRCRSSTVVVDAGVDGLGASRRRWGSLTRSNRGDVRSVFDRHRTWMPGCPPRHERDEPRKHPRRAAVRRRPVRRVSLQARRRRRPVTDGLGGVRNTRREDLDASGADNHNMDLETNADFRCSSSRFVSPGAW